MAKTKTKDELLTVPELAVELEKGRSTVYKWTAREENPLPLDDEGRTTVAAAKAWYEEHGDARTQRQPDALNEREELAAAATEHSVEYRKFKALGERLKVEELEGTLIPAVEVEALLVERATEFKRTLEAMTTRVARRLVGRTELEIRGLLRAEVRKILTKYSRPNPITTKLIKSGTSTVIRRGRRRR